MKTLKEIVTTFFFDCDARERERGDKFGIFIYGIAWIYFGAVLVMLQSPEIDYAMKTYIYFDIICVVYIVLHLWRASNKNLEFPTKEMWMKSILLVLALMGVLAIFSMILDQIVFAKGQLLDLQDFIFEYFRIIPIEELAFRGLGIEIFLLLDKRKPELTIIKSSDSEEPKTIPELLYENKFFIIGAITSSILFGVLHFRAYPDQTIPLIYLTALGLCLAYVRFKYGLYASMMLHALNNFLATTVALLLFGIVLKVII